MIERISEIFHRNGVNLNDVGYVYIQSQSSNSLSLSLSHRHILLQAMIARTLKCIVRASLRSLNDYSNNSSSSSNSISNIESSLLEIIFIRLLIRNNDDKKWNEWIDEISQVVEVIMLYYFEQ